MITNWVNNQKIDDSKVILENFNEFFAKVGQNIAKNITKKSKPVINIVNSSSIYLSKVSESEVYKIILKLNKASGIDSINSNTLKLIIDCYYSYHLCAQSVYLLSAGGEVND